MSPDALLTVVVFLIVGLILWREHRQGRGYFSGSRQGAVDDDTPPLSAAERETRLAAINARRRAAALPSIRLTPCVEKPVLPWKSRFGGRAYWPKEMPWPRTPQGEPLYLVTQLNLDEMPVLPGYPETGMLQFFITGDEMMGLVYKDSMTEMLRANSDGARSRVVYHPTMITDESALLHDVPLPGEDTILPLNDEYAVHFERIEDIVPPTDFRFDTIIGDEAPLHDELVEALWDEEEAGSCSKLGGYANFTQDDPRHWLPDASRGDWLLLFQLNTTQGNGVEIMWGDAGVGNWFIHRDDLARRDFSRAYFNWDCC